MFYVYEWYIEETNEVIYVGKGCRNRYKVRKHNKFFNEMIKRYKCNSRIVKEFETEKEAFDYEFIRVNDLRAKGQCVCNIYNGGTGGTASWWTDEIKEKYSKNNVMKSENQRERMRKHNPMSDPKIAEKTNGQKRKPVIIDGIRYISIKEASQKIGVSADTIDRWCKKGHSTKGIKCSFDMHGNQQPSQGKSDNSTLKGSTTNG